jgi:peptidase E
MFSSINKIKQKISSHLSIKKTSSNYGQIIALGGGGFSDQPDNLLLDEYLLLQTNLSKPKVLFLPTAGGDHQEYIDKFYSAYKKFNCIPSHLSLSKEKISQSKLENIVLSQDLIFVGGGSPKFLMNIWRKTGMIKIIKTAWKQGIVLSGMSAGAICWFEDGFTNPKNNIWKRIKCLGFLEGSFCPHYDSMNDLRLAYKNMIKSSEISSGYGVQDGTALHFIGTELKYIISNLPHSKAFIVKKSGFRVTEKEITPAYLGILKDSYKLKNISDENENCIPPESVNIVKQYIDFINTHNIEGLINLTDENALFTDSMGINTKGLNNMKKAWDILWSFFPDYHLNVKEIICKNGLVAVFGTASGTLAADGKLLPDYKFEIPASWTATVNNGKITKWNVYADNQPVRKLINKLKSQ